MRRTRLGWGRAVTRSTPPLGAGRALATSRRATKDARTGLRDSSQRSGRGRRTVRRGVRGGRGGAGSWRDHAQWGGGGQGRRRRRVWPETAFRRGGALRPERWLV